MKFSAKMIVLLIFFLAIAAVNAAEEVNDDTILSESTDYNAVDNSATLSQSVTNTVDDNSTVSSEIDNSDLFIACTKLDEANIVAAWTAKKISDIETVAFVSKLEYFRSFKKYRNGRFRKNY